MVAFEVVPGVGIGPFRLGMTRDEAASAAELAGLPLEPTTRALPGGTTYVVGRQLFLYFDSSGTAEEIEVAISGPVTVAWRGLALDSPAGDVLAAFDKISARDTSHPEYPATTCYPLIGLCLWTDGKPGAPLSGRFESALVRRPRSATL